MTRVASRDGTTSAFEKAGNGPAVIEVLGDGAVPQDTVEAIIVPALVMDGENSMDFMRPTADRIAHLMPRGER